MKTPQEKKRLSLKKDCRNSYGESRHAARKSIPLRKAMAHRSDRHKQDHILSQALAVTDEDQLIDIENSVKGQAPHPWRKYPDRALGEILEASAEYDREFSEYRQQLVQAKAERLEAYLAKWFPAELRRTRPPEYITLVERITESFKGDVHEATYLAEILQLVQAWEQYR